MVQENRLYFYLSKLILDFFTAGTIKDGSKYQIRFERESDVHQLYSCLKTFAEAAYKEEGIEVVPFLYNDYETYALNIKDTKIIIASHDNEDLLTGLRNNFQKVSHFESNSAIFFIHSSELESINKGAESLASRDMPLHYETVSRNIISEFSKEPAFTSTQKEFLRELIKSESSDYQIENSNVFDLKKYLIILITKKLVKEDYNLLGVFFDEKVHDEELPKKEIRYRVLKNRKYFSEISQNEELGTLDDYLERHFDKSGQKALSDRENWQNVSFDQILKYEENRDNIKFNEYIPNIDGITCEGNIIWDKEEGTSASKSKIRNIIIFNPKLQDELSVDLKFKKRPSLEAFSGPGLATIEEENRSLHITFSIQSSTDFSVCRLLYTEMKDGKKNTYVFKVLVVPFAEAILRPVKTKYIVQIQKNGKFGIEFYSDDYLLFNEDGLDTEPILFYPSNAYELSSEQSLKLELGEVDVTDSLSLPFTLNYKSASIFARFVMSGIKPAPIGGQAVWSKKNISKKSFYYLKRADEKRPDREIITLEHFNTVYFPTGDFRENLKLEEEIIDLGYSEIVITEHGKLEDKTGVLPPDLDEAYKNIISYFRSTIKGSYRILPSTIYVDGELRTLYQKYINIYLSQLNNIEQNGSLSITQKSLLRIGTIREQGNLERLKLSPLHPLLVAYQLTLLDSLDEQFWNNENGELAKKFSPINLLPFINDGGGEKEYFIGVDQDQSPDWLYYVNATVEGQSINRKNVPEMMSSKIREFVKHFSFLYIEKNAPIRLNLINIGDGREALQGIFEYFSSATKELSKNSKNPNDVFPISINIYGSESFVTCFEQFSKFENAEIIKSEFGINLEQLRGKLEVEDFLKLYHEKVQFFLKTDSNKNETNYEYAHITFHQFDESDVEKSDNNTSEIASGVSLGGILSDLPSIYSQGNYRTGFGVKYLEEVDGNILLQLSRKLNSLAHIEGTSQIYKDHYAFASVINSKVKQNLQEVYSSSQWVTFINPRVDLSFFKSDKDVVIIHYTDQYSTSSGFDSITVTSKWEQYEYILKDYLNSKVENLDGAIKPIIDMFNAINGYWLLKLGSQNPHEKVEKEKVSILSAVKELLAILDHPKITWVVLSLEEILRVTGGAGLKQKSGLFSVKNLNKTGQFSDDLLMVGLEEIEGVLQLYFYPVEVKIGNNSSQVIKKGVTQGKNSFELIIKTLSQSGLSGKIYRNYFSKLILTGAQKLALYNVWPEYSPRWENIERWRGKLLNDSFSIGTLNSYIGNFGVLSFKENSSYGRRELTLRENYLQISLFESDGLNDLVQSVEKLKARYSDQNAIGITISDLFEQKYCTSVVRNILEDPDFLLSVESEAGIEIIDEDSLYIEEIKAEESLKKETIEEPVQPYSKSPLKVLFGSQASNGKPIDWFPTSTNKVMHMNTGIIGTMGTGKTQFTKSLITQLIRNTKDNVEAKKLGILIFDYKGDYIKEDFVNATNAKIYELHKLPYNPLALAIGKNPKPLLPLHTTRTLQETISKAFTLGNIQKTALRGIIMQAYANAGIIRDEPKTWGRIAPTINEVCEIYLESENPKIDSLHAALTEIYDYEIFESDGEKTKPLFELIDGVTIINLNGYSTDLQNLIVAITLDQFYSQMQIDGHSKIDGDFRQINKIVLVDEADNFLSKDFESLRKILKEGREYGVGTILSTQFLNHFITAENEYSNYILTWIIHRVNEIKDKEIATLFDLPNRNDRDALTGVIKSLDKHYSIVNLAGSEPIKIKDKAFWELIKDFEPV